MTRLLCLGLALLFSTPAFAQDAGEAATAILRAFVELADEDGGEEGGGYCGETSSTPPFQSGACGKALDADPTGACVGFDNAAWRTATCDENSNSCFGTVFVYIPLYLVTAGVLVGGSIKAVECISGGSARSPDPATEIASATSLTWDGRPVEVVHDRAEADVVLHVRAARRGVGLGDAAPAPRIEAFDPRSGLPLPARSDRLP